MLFIFFRVAPVGGRVPETGRYLADIDVALFFARIGNVSVSGRFLAGGWGGKIKALCVHALHGKINDDLERGRKTNQGFYECTV